MIVEMLGSPGAGKTSLLPAVRGFFAGQGRRAYSVVEAARPIAARTRPGKFVTHWLPAGLHRPVLWQIFYAYARKYQRTFIRQYPELMESVLSFQNQRPIAEPDRRHVLHWFIHMTGVVAFMSEYLAPNEILILDEGFVHRVVQLFTSENEEPDRRRVADYLGLIPRPDLVVYISSPGDLSVQRVFNRGLWKRFQAKSQAETLRFLANAQAVVQFTAATLSDIGWPLIEVLNSGQSIESSGLELQRALSAWMTSSRELIPV